MLAALFLLVPTVMGFAVPRQTGCTSDTLPSEFIVDNFTSKSSDNGTTLSEFSFEYAPYTASNESLPLATCSYNASSVPVEIPGRANRWACDNSLAQFIFESGELTMIQKTCIQNGSPIYEASGAVVLDLSCASNSNSTLSKRSDQVCTSSSSTLSGVFYSLTPVMS